MVKNQESCMTGTCNIYGRCKTCAKYFSRETWR